MLLLRLFAAHRRPVRDVTPAVHLRCFCVHATKFRLHHDEMLPMNVGGVAHPDVWCALSSWRLREDGCYGINRMVFRLLASSSFIATRTDANYPAH
jgi:hypothetical protein